MDASPARFATRAESCSVRFVSRGTANRKCTALVNVGVMLVGLPFSGQAARGNTKPAANAEPQRRDSSRSIGSHPNVEKTVRIQSKTKGLQTQKSPLSQYPLPVLFGGWNRLADEKWLTFSNSGGRQRHGEKRSPPRSASLSMPWSSLTREGVPRGNGESESPCTLG